MLALDREPVFPISVRDEFFCLALAFDRFSLTRWRQRTGQESIIALLQNGFYVAATGGRHMEPSNTPGWAVVYAYPQTRAARFSSVTHRGLFADVSVDSVHLIGHSKTRLDLSVCFCNPDRFVG